MTQPGMLTPGLHASGILAGKRGLVLGIANNRSIAWGIAKAMRREGAELAFTFQNERLKERVEELAADLGSTITVA
ncbi:MAG: SDR family oxidoreductase, partial [Candidatus Acidiferrales bacterium]